IDTFATHCAPADFNETVNTIGKPLYAKQEPRKFGRGTDLHTQSNPLPMCRRPGVLVRLTA
ncbi:major capsid protein, partial [Hahella sp. HN01]